MIFHVFSPSICASNFGCIFNGKWLPNGTRFNMMRWCFWHLSGDLFRTSIFGCILVALWLPFGTLWAPFWSLMVDFGALLAPFWTLWVPLGSILVAAGAILAPFDPSWHHIFKKIVFLAPDLRNLRIH